VNNDWAPAPDDHVVICSGHASGSINTTRTCCRVRGRCECHDDEQRADCDEISHFVILLRRRPIAPRRLIDARRPRRPVTGMPQPPGSKLPQPAEIVHTAITTPHISQDFCSRSSPRKNSRRAFAPALWARGRGLGRPRTLTSDSTTRPPIPCGFEPVSAETQPVSGRPLIQFSDIEKSSSRDSPRDSRLSVRFLQNSWREIGSFPSNPRKVGTSASTRNSRVARIRTAMCRIRAGLRTNLRWRP